MTQAISPLRALLNIEASAPLPRLSSALMLDAPENREIRDIWLLPPDNPSLHAGRKIAVVATDGVEEIELTTVMHYFRSGGAQVDLIAPKKPSYPDFLGLQIPVVRETHIDADRSDGEAGSGPDSRRPCPDLAGTPARTSLKPTGCSSLPYLPARRTLRKLRGVNEELSG